MLGAQYIIPQALVTRSWEFLRERGALGFEGMLLWAGRPARAAAVTRLVIPAQTAIKTSAGVCVAMQPSAQHNMPLALKDGENYLIRVHSHPRRAFHSSTDDQNLVLSHDGAISIVVPNFCIRDYALIDCAIFEWDLGAGWRELTPAEITKRFRVL